MLLLNLFFYLTNKKRLGLITSTVETEAKKIAIEAIAEAKLAVHIKAVYQR